MSPAEEIGADEDVTRDGVLLVAYLLASARGLIGEPASYGPFRLMDAAARVVQFLQEHALAASVLAGVRERIEARKPMGSRRYSELAVFVDELLAELSANLADECSRSGGSGPPS